METSTIVWIIVGIVVVIAIIVIVVLMTNRQRREAHLESERKKAADLRQDAYETDVARREREAEAARAAAAAKQAEADAMQARLESERLARESAAHQSDAQQMRSDVDERLRKADAVDPDVDTDRNDTTARDRGTLRGDQDAAIGFYNTFAAVAAPGERTPRLDLEVASDAATGIVHALRGPGVASMQGHLESVTSPDGFEALERLVDAVLAGQAAISEESATSVTRG